MNEDRRFGGIGRLFGYEGSCRIFDSHVAIIGIGGVGSWVAESLARSGVGKITLIDFDQVSESNINRQIHATGSSLGMAKVFAMRNRIHSYFPECQVNCIEEFVTCDNWPSILPLGVNGVVDACDQTRVKVHLGNWALRSKIPFVMVGAAGGKKSAHMATVSDLCQVTHDPLLAKVRYQIRKDHTSFKHNKKFNLQCVYSNEPISLPERNCTYENDGTLNCHGYGSLVTVTATFGQHAAGVILNNLSMGI